MVIGSQPVHCGHHPLHRKAGGFELGRPCLARHIGARTRPAIEHPRGPSVHRRVRKVGIQRHVGALCVERQCSRTHGGVVAMNVAQARRRIYQGILDEHFAQRPHDLSRRLVALAVLPVQERQVDRRVAGARKRPAVLLDTRADHRGRIARARELIPPAERAGGRLARKDVHHEHLAGARQHVPARQHRVVEVGREDHRRVGTHRCSLSPACVWPP